MEHLFWDSCVFAAFLFEESTSHDVGSIKQYLDEARAGKYRIYTSSVVFAEIANSKIKKRGIGSFRDFMADFVSATVVVDASVNIMDIAGRLKDIPYKKGKSDKRFLATGDAIMLATALYIEDAFDVKVDCFHTLDDTAKKQVPLLSYHDWCEGLKGENARLAKRIIDLKREKPIHPTPDLFVK